MDCPNCKYPDMHVVRSNYAPNDSVERRRECGRCKHRITTQEIIRPSKKEKDKYVLVT